MSQRGQIAIAAIGGLTAVLLGAVVLLYLGRIAAGGAGGQTAADMAALAAARSLASDPSTAPARVRASADAAARDNGARLVSLRIERTGAVATAVDVTTAVDVDGTLPVAGPQHRRVLERARAGVAYSAQLPAQSFRPVDLHGARGPLAAVAAAEAQIGWPYVWGGESRAEGGFDCSGLIDYAYAAAGLVLPGRPTAADLWRLAAPENPMRWRRATWCSSAPPPEHPTMWACTSAVARSWRLHTRARLFATSRSPPEAGTASGGSPGRPRRGLRSTRPSSVRRAPIRSRRTSSQRSSSSGSWPMPVPQPRRWQRPSAVTRATSRQRLPTRSATARWRRPSFAKGQGPASRVRAGRSAFSPSATRPRHRSRHHACTSRRCRRRRIRPAGGAR